MLKLLVLKTFNGKDEGKLLNPGDTITTNDVTRINTLVARGLCKVDSFVEEENNDKANDGNVVTFNDNEYDVETIKKALKSIGVNVAANAKKAGVSKAIDGLSDEQAVELSNALNATE